MPFPFVMRRIIPLLVCGFLLGGVAIVRADESLEHQAEAELEQAKSATGLEQQSHLKNAAAILHHLPPGISRRYRGEAESYIKSAIFDAQQGDPYHNVDEDIRHAEDAIDRVDRR